MKQNYINIGAIVIALCVIGGSSWYYLQNRTIDLKDGLSTTKSQNETPKNNASSSSTQTVVTDYKNDPAQEPVKNEKSAISYLYTTKGDTAYYLNTPMTGVDIETFTVDQNLGDDFAKDKNSLYYNGLKVEGVDAATFTLVSPTFFFAKDKTRVYFIEHTYLGMKNTRDGQKFTDVAKVIKPLVGADVKSFKVGASETNTMVTPAIVTTKAADNGSNYIVTQERRECYGDALGCVGNITVSTKKK